MSFNWRMKKQTVVHPYSGIPLSNKKESATYMSSNKSQSQMCYAKWKKPDFKGSILLISFTFWKKQNYRHRKQTSGLQGLGTWGRGGWRLTTSQA